MAFYSSGLRILRLPRAATASPQTWLDLLYLGLGLGPGLGLLWCWAPYHKVVYLRPIARLADQGLHTRRRRGFMFRVSHTCTRVRIGYKHVSPKKYLSGPRCREQLQ